MIIVIGVHSLPQLEDYWSSDILLGVPGIVDGMPINRFEVLEQCLHLNDNTTMKTPGDPGYDPLHKICQLLRSGGIDCSTSIIPFHVDICIVNAHVVQSESPHQTNLMKKEFRLELARELLSSYNTCKHPKREGVMLLHPSHSVAIIFQKS